MKGQEKRKLIETDDKPSRTFEYQNDEPENQTSGIILNANISNKKLFIGYSKTEFTLFRFDRCKKEKLPMLR